MRHASGEALDEPFHTCAAADDLTDIVIKPADRRFCGKQRLGQRHQHRQHRHAKLLHQAANIGFQSGQVVVEGFGLARGFAVDYQPKPLRFCRQFGNAIAALVQEGDHGQAFLAEQFDGQGGFLGAIRHLLELFGQLQQRSFRVVHRHPQLLEDTGHFLAAAFGFHHVDR